jgi:hypothetical protein
MLSDCCSRILKAATLESTASRTIAIDQYPLNGLIVGREPDNDKF